MMEQIELLEQPPKKSANHSKNNQMIAPSISLFPKGEGVSLSWKLQGNGEHRVGGHSPPYFW